MDRDRGRGLIAAARALQLPRPLRVFTRRMAARFVGPARYDSRFRRFAIPLFASRARRAAVDRVIRADDDLDMHGMHDPHASCELGIAPMTG
ncbi:hypothetical protein [Sorangium sp. So ce1151]|uniref:hypothetical protein n=1 Tax=Sorangium sp. So ce1151 TaxID=3133332 RepID=UPI003F601B84